MWDFASLQRVAVANREGNVSLTLCSGRPAGFLEALARQLMITTHCICENGSMLMHPLTKRTILHPDIPHDYLRQRQEIVRLLQQYVAGTPTVIEFGKEVMISVNSPDKSLLDDLFAAVEQQLQGAPVQLMNSGRSIEVVPVGVTKAAGLHFWAEVERVPIAEVISIGDADNDLDILRAAGRAAAPANCTPGVRAVVDYVAPEPMVRGVLDILGQCGAANWS